MTMIIVAGDSVWTDFVSFLFVTYYSTLGSGIVLGYFDGLGCPLYF